MDLVRVESKGERYRGNKSIAVLALKGEIVEAFAAGYSRRVVWRALLRAGLIELCYDRFRIVCQANGMVPRASSRRRGRPINRPHVKRADGDAAPPRRPWEPDLKEIYGTGED